MYWAPEKVPDPWHMSGSHLCSRCISLTDPPVSSAPATSGHLFPSPPSASAFPCFWVVPFKHTLSPYLCPLASWRTFKNHPKWHVPEAFHGSPRSNESGCLHLSGLSAWGGDNVGFLGSSASRDNGGFCPRWACDVWGCYHIHALASTAPLWVSVVKEKYCMVAREI